MILVLLICEWIAFAIQTRVEFLVGASSVLAAGGGPVWHGQQGGTGVGRAHPTRSH